MFPGWTAAALVLALVAGHATHGVDTRWRGRDATTCRATSIDPGIAHTARVLERGAPSRAPARPVSGHHAIASSGWALAGVTPAFTIIATRFVTAAPLALLARAARARGPPRS